MVKLLLGDAQVFDFEPGAFDLATSRMGVMFFANPTAAFRNIGGGLKPGGRLTFACWGPLQENRHWLISYDIALRHLGSPAPQPANAPSPLAFADPDYIRGFLAAAGFAEVTVERAHPTIIGGSPEEEAQQALMMGPTARLIEEKKPGELTRQTIAREIEAAFAAEAKSGPIRLPATIFVVAARRPVFNAIKPQGRFPGSLSAPYWRFDPHRHMPRMRAAISTRTPLLAPLAANSGSASGQATLSKSPSSSSGMKRVREA